jgi:2,4-dienoyl-CoA reductase-like NADH-dependent reductase (Old Yellow Enzyme family)
VNIPTRYFLAPVNTGFFANGLPTEGLRRFHQERSGRSIGVSYVGNVAVDPEYAASPTTAFLSQHRAWELIADAIASNGSAPGIQLACKTLGEAAPKKWVNHDISQFISHMRSHLMSLPTCALDRVFERFVWAADAAWRHGFRVIQVHAAHGYLLALLLSQDINTRSDQYGDGVDALRRLIGEIRGLGHAMVLDVRLSLSEGLRTRAEELEAFDRRIDQIAAADVDIISLSDGFYDVNKFAIYPRLEDGFGCYIDAAAACATKCRAKLWNVAGNIWDIGFLKPRLPPNLSFSIGRSLIADPLFVEKSLHEASARIRACVRSGHCHYYSRGRLHLECKVNADVGGDASYQLPIVE